MVQPSDPAIQNSSFLRYALSSRSLIALPRFFLCLFLFLVFYIFSIYLFYNLRIFHSFLISIIYFSLILISHRLLSLFYFILFIFQFHLVLCLLCIYFSTDTRKDRDYEDIKQRSEEKDEEIKNTKLSSQHLIFPLQIFPLFSFSYCLADTKNLTSSSKFSGSCVLT